MTIRRLFILTLTILTAYALILLHTQGSTPTPATFSLTHDLTVCRRTFSDCHIERDRDGSRSVYGKAPIARPTPAPATTIAPPAPTTPPAPPTTTAPRRIAPTPTTLAPGTITWSNTPDGRCHEDMPCWDCATMGNRICGRVPGAPASWPGRHDPTAP